MEEQLTSDPAFEALRNALLVLVHGHPLTQALSYLSTPKAQRELIRAAQVRLGEDTDEVAGVAGRESLRRALLARLGVECEMDTPTSSFPIYDL